MKLSHMEKVRDLTQALLHGNPPNKKELLAEYNRELAIAKDKSFLMISEQYQESVDRLGSYFDSLADIESLREEMDIQRKEANEEGLDAYDTLRTSLLRLGVITEEKAEELDGFFGQFSGLVRAEALYQLGSSLVNEYNELHAAEMSYEEAIKYTVEEKNGRNS